jgi:hypothetical protein
MQFNPQLLKSVRNNANAGRAILVVAALVSGIATGKMMHLGSSGDPFIIMVGKVVLGLGLIEGGLAFAYHGIRKVFTNGIQRKIAWAFLFLLVAAVLCNLFTERMLARGIPLHPFQQAWVDWAFDGVVVVVMLAIGAIQLFSDEQRLERHALKVIGEEAEEKLRKARGEFPNEIEAESRETGPIVSGKDRPRW